jgi:glycosyltransferase involved in cell wall biosynthesis
MKVFMIPKNHEYINRLKRSLEAVDVKVEILKPFHYSSLMNLLKMIYFRLRGHKIIHVHWLYIFPFGMGMRFFHIFCKSFGIRVIWEMHNIIPHHCTKHDRNNAKWFYEKVDAIIFHCEDDVGRSKEMLKTSMDKAHIVIPHGSFNESYENRISKDDARKLLHIPENKKVILCFGFIRKNRGYEFLIEAAKDMHDTIILIAGKVLEKDVYRMLLNYERKVSNLRLFAKWIPDEEIQWYFNACDIVVLPYTEITTSGVIPLAYAFSRPVITSDIGGMRYVVNANTGILVRPRDISALRKAIEELLSMDFEVMGRYAREYARKEFSWESNARKIKELYDSILTDRVLTGNDQGERMVKTGFNRFS